MKIKVSEATHRQIDWLVATIENDPILTCATGEPTTPREFASLQAVGWANYSTSPVQAWPIIDRERIKLEPSEYWLPPRRGQECWVASYAKAKEARGVLGYFRMADTNPLVAAMRSFIASELGHEVDVPEELT